MSGGFLQQLAVSLGALLIVLLVLVLLLAGAIFWWFKTRFRRWESEVNVRNLDWLPPRLHLVPAPIGAEGFDRTAHRVEALQTLGFQEIGRYSVSNYDTLKLVALTHPEHGYGAVVYYLSGLGTWSDLFLPGQNGEWINVSNVRRRYHFLHLPGERTFHEPNKTEAELLAILLKSGQGSAVARLTQENFAAAFEAAYARRSNQRLLEPVEDYELRHILREMEISTCSSEDGVPGELTDKDVEATRAAYDKLRNKQLANACALDFMRGLSAAEWQRSRFTLLVVHDRTPLRDLKRRGSAESFVTPVLKKKLKRAAGKRTPREEFAEINAGLPLRERYQKLGSVPGPVPADIYRAPMKGFST